MSHHIENKRVLYDGRLVLYHRTDIASATWHCRIKFPDELDKRFSLKTRDEKDAVRKAEKLYDDMRYRLEKGLPLESVKFVVAMSSYFDWLKYELEAGNIKKAKYDVQKTYTRYFGEYFDGKRIDKISDAEIERYVDWRRRYWTSGPGAASGEITYVRNGKRVRSKRPKKVQPAISTQNNEATVLRAIFKHARKNGWISEGQIPVVPRAKGGAPNRRPSFTDEEVQHLLNVAEQREYEVTNGRIRFLRGLLYAFAAFIAYSGMRPFEAMRLKWEDITWKTNSNGQPIILAYVSGKNKERTLVTREYITEVIFRLQLLHAEHRKDIPDDERWDNDLLRGPIFCDTDGTPIRTFKKSFRELLQAAGLEFDRQGRKRDSYSLRHFYATERLLTGIDIYTLSTNLGTSVKMIEDHYGHVRPEMAKDELTQERPLSDDELNSIP